MRWKVSALANTRAPRRASSVEEVSTGVRWATPARRAAARSTSANSIGRSASGSAVGLAGVVHERAERHRGQVLLVQSVEQLAEQGLQGLGAGYVELHHLAGPQRPECVVGVLQPDGALHQVAAGAVGHEPL